MSDVDKLRLIKAIITDAWQYSPSRKEVAGYYEGVLSSINSVLDTASDETTI